MRFYGIANYLTWVLSGLYLCWLDSSNTLRMWPDIFRRVSVRLPINPATSDLLSTQLLIQLGTFAMPTIRLAPHRTISFFRSALESHLLVCDYWGTHSLGPEENLSTTLRKSRSQTSLLESSSLPVLTSLIFKFFC